MTDSNPPIPSTIDGKRPVRKQIWFDIFARTLITSGGAGTIVVALLIVFVMISQLLPLLSTSDATNIAEFTIAHDTNLANPTEPGAIPSDSKPLCAGMDEYGDIAWFLFPSGRIHTYDVATGQRLRIYESKKPIVDGTVGSQEEQAVVPEITAFCVADDDASLLLGYSDGSVRPITIHWKMEYRDGSLDTVIQPSESDNSNSERPVLTELPNGLVRVQSIESIDFHEPIHALSYPVRCVDWLTPAAIYGLEKVKSWKWLASDGQEILVQHHLRRRLGISLSNSEEIKTWRMTLATDQLTSAMLNAQGESVTSITTPGLAQLWRLTPDNSVAHLASHWTIAGSESNVVNATPILGRNTLLLSSESGDIEGIAPYYGETKSDLVSIHHIPLGPHQIRQLSPATNTRVVAVLTNNGEVTLIYIPTNRTLLRWQTDPESTVFFSAGSRFMGAIYGNSVRIAKLNLKFPEAGWQSFLSANWFEGYDSPTHMWQSSSGTIEGEIKLSIIPLVFGTLKATFYTLLIAIPLGLISAIFSSEYLHPKNRARIKPIMELMASVPSVALGFVGAVALAPLVRDNLFGLFVLTHLTLLRFVCIPAIFMTLPRSVSTVATRYRAIPLILALIISILIARLFSRDLETALFGGPLPYWLSGEFGNAFPGWLCLTLIPCGVASYWALIHFQLERKIAERFGWLAKSKTIKSLVLHIAFILACISLSSTISAGLAWCGWDARGTILNSYQERNALLVGVVLGFAIVPLIFTLSEDALQAVPQHLRAASMSCGATVWQTTMRVVIPTALSGLFSAIMLGLGRAIGETMVVLMVSGNSPIMELNPFSGFRTLSGTLAMELPEAARGSTHYHALFFVSLNLFFLTVVVNSIAEFVRLRFKRNASQL